MKPNENRQAIPSPHVVAAMRRVLDYLWIDEQADYLGLPSRQRAGHIFVSLRLFHHWLLGRLMSDNEAAHSSSKGTNRTAAEAQGGESK